MTEQATSFYNVVLIEGPPDEVKGIVDDLIAHFPAAIVEGPEETQRHRNWFAKEVGGFRQPFVAGHISSAHRFQSEGGKPPTFVPASLPLVVEVMERYKHRAVIGYAAIDRQKAEWAGSVGMSTDSPNGTFVGALASNRYNYFRVMKHFFYNDDANAFFRDFTTEKAIGPIPYNHGQQWSKSTSPLRLEFCTEDPARDGWSLAHGSDSSAPGYLTKDGFLPALGVSVAAHLNWLTTIALLLRSGHYGVHPHIDRDGQLMISGYALRAAGLIDLTLKPTFSLLPAEVTQFGLGDPPSEESAMVAVLKLYVHCLSDARENFAKQAGCSELLLRIQNHIQGALQWLVQNGHIQRPFMGEGSTAVN
jgi:hypothetical protein